MDDYTPVTKRQYTLALVGLLTISGCFSPNASTTGEGSTTGAVDPAGSGSNGSTDGTAATSGPSSTDSTTLGPETTGGPSTGVDTDGSTSDWITAGSDSTGPSVNSTGEESTTGTESEGETTGTGELAECGDGRVCVPFVPEGWNGPVAARTLDIEDDIPPCGGGSYTDLQVSDALADLTSSDYECSCSCDTGDLGCEGVANLSISDYPPPIPAGLSPCSNPTYVYSHEVDSDAPQAVSIEMEDLRGIVLDEPPEPDVVGQCDPSFSVEETPAGFGTRTIACGTFDVLEEGCGDGLCVPQPTAPYDAPVCIWAEGDLECPTGFDNRTVYHSELVDDRSCSDCSCGAPSGTCGESDRLYIDAWCEREGFTCFGPDCGPGGSFECPAQARYNASELSSCEPIVVEDFCPSFPPPGSPPCEEYSLYELNSLTYSVGAVSDAACIPSGGAPTGGVNGADAKTFCCAGG